MLKKPLYLFSYFIVSLEKSLKIEILEDVKEIIFKKYYKEYVNNIISDLFYKFYTERVKSYDYIKCIDCKRYRHHTNIHKIDASLMVPFFKQVCKKYCRFKYPCGHYNIPIPVNNQTGYYYMQNCSTCNIYQYIGFYWVGSPPFFN